MCCAHRLFWTFRPVHRPSPGTVLVGILLMSGLLLTEPPAQAQSADAVTIEAVADPNPVGTEEEVTLTIRVQGAALSAIETPEPPLTRNLSLRRPTPSTERDVSFSNGRLTRSVTFRWTYEPVRAGAARLYPVSVLVHGAPYETEAIDIEVIPQQQRGASAPPAASSQSPPSSSRAPSEATASLLDEQDLFIRVQPAKRRAYQNEQLTVTYHLYFRSGIQLRHSRLASAWDATGFWREELNVESRPIPRSTTLNGQSYQTIVLKRAALFPTRAGSLRVDPLEIKTEARAGRQYDPARPFYTPQTDYEPISLASDPLVIEARPLPDGAPEHFDGAVGSFRLHADVDSAHVSVGRPVRLQVHIEGTGNVATLSPPDVAAPDGVTLYDPEEQLSIDRDGAQIQGTKTFTYVLVPQSNGSLTFSPITFSYFDPTAEQYRTLRTSPITLRVTEEAPPATDDASVARVDTPQTRSSSNQWYLHLWPYAAALVGLLALAGLIFARRRAPSDAPAADPPASNMRDPDVLASARYQMRHNPAACYDAIERAVLGFIGRRLDVAATGYTRPQLEALLTQNGVPRNAREALFELLDVCDQARYSPARSSEEAMQSAIHRAEQLIDFLDAKLP